MAENKAAQDLANLTRSTEGFQRQAAQEAAVAAQAGQQGANVASGGGGEEASLALPEGIATAVVGSFLFGPAGGLLLGAAQSWLGKQERQNVLDQQASRNEAIGGAEDILRGQFESLYDGPNVTSEDTQLLDNLRTQQEAAFRQCALRMLRSGDPVMMQAGMSAMQSVQSSVADFSRNQETQRIDMEVREAEDERILGVQNYSRYKDLLDDFDSRSGDYVGSLEKGREIISLLESGNPFELNAALTDMAKLMDPTSAAMEGEVNAWRNIGNLVDRFQKYAGALSDGKQLNEDQARDLEQTVLTIMDGRRQIQLKRQDMYLQRLGTAMDMDVSEIPQRFRKSFNLVDDMPAVRPGNIQWQTFTGDAKTAGKALADAVDTGIDAAGDTFMDAFEKGQQGLQWLNENRINPYLPMSQQIEQGRRIMERNQQRQQREVNE